METLALALAPVLILLFYIYLRDKYDREPLWLLAKGVLAGIIITAPVIFTEAFLDARNPFPADAPGSAAWQAFIVAGLTEEAFKLLAVMMVFWRSRAFNERFDGIVYAVFVSLGFAAVENILYVSQGGTSVGVMRAFTSVPGHAAFGVIMGYYLGRARLEQKLRPSRLLLALLMPVLFHGTYNFLLLAGNKGLVILFYPFLYLLYRTGLRRMRYLSDHSAMRPGAGRDQI